MFGSGGADDLSELKTPQIYKSRQRAVNVNDGNTSLVYKDSNPHHTMSILSSGKLHKETSFQSNKSQSADADTRENANPNRESQSACSQPTMLVSNQYPSDFDMMRRKFLEMQSSLKAYQDSIMDLTSEVKQLKNENLKLNSDIRVIRNEHTDVGQSIQQLRCQNKELTNENSGLRDMVNMRAADKTTYSNTQSKEETRVITAPEQVPQEQHLLHDQQSDPRVESNEAALKPNAF
jgi:chromosome segregation ATPase